MKIWGLFAVIQFALSFCVSIFLVNYLGSTGFAQYAYMIYLKVIFEILALNSENYFLIRSLKVKSISGGVRVIDALQVLFIGVIGSVQTLFIVFFYILDFYPFLFCVILSLSVFLSHIQSFYSRRLMLAGKGNFYPLVDVLGLCFVIAFLVTINLKSALFVFTLSTLVTLVKITALSILTPRFDVPKVTFSLKRIALVFKRSQVSCLQIIKNKGTEPIFGILLSQQGSEDFLTIYRLSFRVPIVAQKIVDSFISSFKDKIILDVKLINKHQFLALFLNSTILSLVIVNNSILQWVFGITIPPEYMALVAVIPILITIKQFTKYYKIHCDFKYGLNALLKPYIINTIALVILIIAILFQNEIEHTQIVVYILCFIEAVLLCQVIRHARCN